MRSAWLLLIGTTVACGARTDIPEGEDLDSSVLEDVSVIDSTLPDVSPPPVKDATTDLIVVDVEPPPDDVVVIDAPPPPPPPACIADCTHNFQCEQSCPPIQTGRWCCDEQVGACYAWNGKHCPTQILDAGFD